MTSKWEGLEGVVGKGEWLESEASEGVSWKEERGYREDGDRKGV